jgi:hypothetical protein
VECRGRKNREQKWGEEDWRAMTHAGHQASLTQPLFPDSLPSQPLFQPPPPFFPQDHTASEYASQELLRVLQPHFSTLPKAALYPSLMLALLRLRIVTPPEQFDAMCTALMEPLPKPSAKAASTARAAAAAGE